MSGLSILSAPEFRPKMRSMARRRRAAGLIPVQICLFPVPAVADAFCPRADGDWNSIFGSGAPIRQCLSDAALFQLTLERKGHRNRRTGGLP